MERKVYRVVIVNGAASDAAYAEDRRPRPNEAQRVVSVVSNGIAGINGAVQAIMMAEGFDHSDWKVLSHSVVQS